MKIPKSLILWTALNLFALVTSYAQISLFADNAPETQKLWPFVKIWEERVKDIPFDYGVTNGPIIHETVFNGLFINYDWSELLLYVGGGFLIVFLTRKNNNS